MRIFTFKRSIAIACSAMLSAAIFQSCGGEVTTLTNEQIAELQGQLDSTMQLYEEVKSKNADFSKQMASRDSAINAQAEEIQSLIDQMGGKKPVGNANKSQVEKQLREKENTIKQLQKQLDQQTKQLNALKSSSNNNASKDNSAHYKNQIAQLQKQIAQQEKQINELKKDSKKQNNNNTGSANCDNVKKSYESQVAELNGEIKTYKNQIADLHKQIKSLKSEVSKMQSAASGNESNAEELKTLKGELRDATVQLNECRRMNTQYQKDVKEAKDDLAKCQSELTSSKEQLKMLQNTQGESGKNEQLLRAELATLTQQEAQCRTQNEELTKSQQALVQECENSKQSLKANISDLQQQVLALQSRVDQLNGENTELKSYIGNKQESNTTTQSDAQTVAELTAQVENQRQQIERLQNELDAAKKNNASATPSKGAVNQKLIELQSLCDGYVAEIERLRAENKQLRNENAELKEKVSSSSDLIAENERLQQKVKLASVLVTSDLKATPAKSVKIGNVVKPTTKASQTNYIRLDCRILDNNVIDPGSMTIFARISNAADRAIFNGSAEDFSFDLNGTKMQYTAKQDIEFTGSGRTLTMLWKKGDSVELTPGLYWVKLYANGYEIGKVSFKLD